MADQMLWQPSPDRINASNLRAFMQAATDRWRHGFSDYNDLHAWSVEEPEEFWLTLWDFCDVIGKRGERVAIDREKMPGARFFPDGRINFAENLLRKRDNTSAVFFRAEDKVDRELTWAELHDAVSSLARAFRLWGLAPGDRVAAYTPNIPEALIAMLAATSLGCVFTSASPDFGVQGVLDRFGQVEPKVLISADAYYYNGKVQPCLDKLPAIVGGMPSVERVLIVPYVEADPDIAAVPKAELITNVLAAFSPGEIEFTRVGFNDPLYILYSSGTTGAPKCIVQGVGPAVLTHGKEHRIHSDVKPGDRVFWFTTCGWMMWNWVVAALAAEAAVVLYDGSPFYPDGNVLFDYADDVGITLFGTSAKFIDACNKASLVPKETHDLSSIRTIGSTGSVLAPEGFDYVYSRVKTDVHLASVSGGTDLLGCFVGGNPMAPVFRGELQAPILGMKIEVYDDLGQPLPPGEKGELVCTRSFPSMPIGFWGDEGGDRYFNAYYADYENVWRHGDWVEWRETGGMVFFGRSDATLNSGGVRIGTAEIYRQVEKMAEIQEAIVVGQDWDNDTRIVLFVVLREGRRLTEALERKIRVQIREGASPRHVPACIAAVPDIPRTKSGKIVELAVRDILHDRPVKNREALANPGALEHFRDRPELAAR
ncbi:MAG: acetoacetate--CoA ligase [Rhodospirillaceae bacterium]|nr:acetoacetate--CoA ligase [Rhodospirillaceae bacterium]